MQSIKDLVGLVTEAGAMAAKRQRALRFADREHKADGSVVTEADRMVEDFLCERIDRLHPGCNFVTEERSRGFDPARPFTFAIDPIDGTDGYSQGMHGWCVAVGLLDRSGEPLAGIVFAPALGLLFAADAGGRVEVNGRPAGGFGPVGGFTGNSCVMASSQIHHELDLRRFPGKVRSIGSAALHLCFPALYPGVIGALQDRRAFIWDVAAAHAICRAAGCAVTYLDGSALDYQALQSSGWQLRDFVIAGRGGAHRLLQECVKRI
ncbi:MAG: inositol monophosphatase [Deltaproteobacteria bacterium]|nr:inositol monophosphatase [Deltaproteobacteria bacterium]